MALTSEIVTRMEESAVHLYDSGAVNERVLFRTFFLLWILFCVCFCSLLGFNMDNAYFLLKFPYEMTLT